MRVVGKNVITYMNSLNKTASMEKTNNKGEWSELLAFFRILFEQQILLSDKDLQPIGNYFKVSKVTGRDINLDFLLITKDRIEVV